MSMDILQTTKLKYGPIYSACPKQTDAREKITLFKIIRGQKELYVCKMFSPRGLTMKL